MQKTNKKKGGADQEKEERMSRGRRGRGEEGEEKEQEEEEKEEALSFISCSVRALLHIVSGLPVNTLMRPLLCTLNPIFH